jgi:hypothetical protein
VIGTDQQTLKRVPLLLFAVSLERFLRMQQFNSPTTTNNSARRLHGRNSRAVVVFDHPALTHD